MSRLVPVGVRLAPDVIADLTEGGQKIGEAVREKVDAARYLPSAMLADLSADGTPVAEAVLVAVTAAHAALFCPSGHRLAGNTNAAGRCRTCEAARVAEYKRNKRAARAAA